MSIIASPAPFAAALTLPERGNSELRSECGVPCNTTCYSQLGGGPDVNDCTAMVNYDVLPNGAHHFTVDIWNFGSPTLLSAVETYRWNSGIANEGLVFYNGPCRTFMSQLTSTGFSYCTQDWVGDCLILSNIYLNNIVCSGWCCAPHC